MTNTGSSDARCSTARSDRDGTIAAVRRFRGMGPKEEDNGVVLLSAVTLVCAAIALVPWFFEATPAQASKAMSSQSSKVPAEAVRLQPARVVVPFTPNITPSQR